jgi:hypothetical protein
MKLLAVRRRPSGAVVDVEISPGVRLFNLTEGRHRLQAPNAFGTRTVHHSGIQAVAAAIKVEPLARDRHA